MDQRDRQNLAVGLVVVALIAVVFLLMSEMRRNAAVEDCLMQRRRNCDQLNR